MDTWRVRVSLFLNFFLFAILLNTVGIVIAQTIVDYGISRVQAGGLEAFKDLSIVVASLLLAAWVPRFGYRRSMLLALAAVAAAAVLIAGVPGFWVAPVLYVAVGSSFALMKLSAYSTVGLISADQHEHTSLMNLLEGIFQVGSLTGPLLFSAMIAWSHWSNTYWLLAALAAVAFLLMLSTPFDESEVEGAPEAVTAGELGARRLRAALVAGLIALAAAGLLALAGWSAGGWGRALGAAAGAAALIFLLHPMRDLFRIVMVWLFVAAAWLYVMIEQSFNTWLPTFNREVFGLSDAGAAALLSVFPASIAASRFLAGWLSKRFSWLALQLSFLAGAFVLTLAVVLVTEDGAGGGSLFGIPPLAVAFSLVGFLIGPVYPTICSIVLARLEKGRHSAMTGLIIIFSALGGTSGSLLIGYLSQRSSTHDAFYFPLVPIALLAAVLVPYKLFSDRFGRAHGTAG